MPKQTFPIKFAHNKALELVIHVVQNRHTGELGRGALGQDKQRAHFIYSCSFLCFAGLSLRGGGRGFSPTAKNVAPGYFHRKIEEK